MPRKLPAALVKNAAHEASLKQSRLAREGRADIALIRRRRDRITEDFYDIGEAIVRLRRPGVVAALGYASFAALCEKALGMGETQASHLVTIVGSLGREDALRLGQERSAALISVAHAMPAKAEVVALATAKVKLPSGKRVDIAKASVAELKEVARELRGARNPDAKPARGRTTSPDERAAATAFEARLHAEGITTARVRAVATSPGKPSKLRIEGIPIDAIASLARAARNHARA
jgi:hypothetical protein